MWNASAHFLLLIVSISKASGLQQATCYKYDGTIMDGHNPCNALAPASACCSENDACLSNGYCLQQSAAFANRLGAPSCTDRDWNSPACPLQCADGMYFQVRKMIGWNADSFLKAIETGPVSVYLAYDTTDGAFCCGG